MKLYLATYNETANYDQYSAFVIAAESEDLARHVLYEELDVSEGYVDDPIDGPSWYLPHDQAPDDFSVTELVASTLSAGVVVSSYRAG